MPPPATVTTEAGAVHRLASANPLGQPGAFGAVYALEGGRLVVKLFHRPPDPLVLLNCRGQAALTTLGAAWCRGVLAGGGGVVMTLAEGETLKEMLDADDYATRPLEDVLALALAVCRAAAAVEALAAPPVAQTDWKPGNVMVRRLASGAWAAVLLDPDSLWLTVLGRDPHGQPVRFPAAYAGTPEYLAPEKVRRPGLPFDAATGHRFPLAVTVYQMVRQTHPCQPAAGGTGLDLNAQVGKRAFVRFKAVAGLPHYPDPFAVPDYVDRLFRRAFLGRSAKRPSAKDWCDCLGRWQYDLVRGRPVTVVASPPPPFRWFPETRAALAARVGRLLDVPSVAVAVLALGALVLMQRPTLVTGWGTPAPPPPPQTAADKLKGLRPGTRPPPGTGTFNPTAND